MELNTASPLGAGGEARVFPVAGDSRLAAKIYHAPDEERARKLAAMLANPPEASAMEAHLLAWPTARLDDARRVTVGYLMPRVSGRRPIFHFYNPLTRRQESPLSNYAYLTRTARNLAAAVRALHSRGYVIGDVNESNILVTETALVTLVDCDSFQVHDPKTGQVFRCPVGKPEYTPPELQGKPFALMDRAPEHDRFGLAVLIFQLLMEGTHPFAGLYTGPDDPPPYEDRIRAGHFPYGAKRVPYRRMPAAPPIEILHPTLRQLFVRCFEDGHATPAARPDALTWQNALREAEEALVTCQVNPQHRYGEHLPACPWCARRELLKGRDPFPTSSDAERYRRREPARRPRATMENGTSVKTAQGANRAGGGTGKAGGTNRVPAAIGAAGGGPTPITRPGNVPGTLPPRARVGNAMGGGGGPIPLAPHGPTGFAANAPPPGAFYNFVNYGGYSSYAAYQAAHANAPAPPVWLRHVPRSVWIWASAGLALLSFVPVHTFWAGPAAVVAAVVGGREAGKKRQGGRWLAIMALVLGALVPLVTASANYASIHSTAPLRILRGGAGSVTAVAFGPRGDIVAGASSRDEDAAYGRGEVAFWNARTGEPAGVLSGFLSDVTALAFAPDGRTLAVGNGLPSGQGDVRIYNLAANSAPVSLPGQAAYVSALAYSPDGTRLAVGSRNRTVRVENAATNETIGTFAVPGDVFSLSWSPDGRRIAVGSGTAGSANTPGRVTVLDTNTGQTLWTMLAHSNAAYAVAFSPDGATLASGGADATIRLWNSASGAQKRTLDRGGGAILSSLAFSPDGATLASGGSDGGVRFWDALTGEPRGAFPEHSLPVTSVAFSPDGRLLASGSQDKTVTVRRLRERSAKE